MRRKLEIETIINIQIARAKLKVVEVPSFERDRLHGTSNLHTWRDGARVLRAALTELLSRRPDAPVRHVISLVPLDEVSDLDTPRSARAGA